MLHPFLPRIVGGQERVFRESRARWEQRELVFIFGLLACLIALGVLNDRSLLRDADSLSAILGLRLLLTGMCCATAGAGLRGASLDVRDRLTLVTVAALVVFDVVNAFNRPPDYVGFVPTSVMIVLVVYVAVPLAFSLKPWILGVEVVGILGVVWAVKDTSTPHALSATAGLVSAWGIGAWVAIQLGRSDRTQYLALAGEREARVELESALSEIKRLQGIVPICSSCKRIRDDEGFWQQVEVYVEEHSDARFSHSTCPACMREMYPGAVTDGPTP